MGPEEEYPEFWDWLMGDQHVEPDPTFYGGAEKAKTSPYWTPDTLVGEIVEDELLELT